MSRLILMCARRYSTYDPQYIAYCVERRDKASMQVYVRNLVDAADNERLLLKTNADNERLFLKTIAENERTIADKERTIADKERTIAAERLETMQTLQARLDHATCKLGARHAMELFEQKFIEPKYLDKRLSKAQMWEMYISDNPCFAEALVQCRAGTPADWAVRIRAKETGFYSRLSAMIHHPSVELDSGALGVVLERSIFQERDMVCFVRVLLKELYGERAVHVVTV